MSQPWSRIACPIEVDDSFGPWAGPACRGGFDFTILFEEAILCIPLQCLLLLILPARLWQLTRMDVKMAHGVLRPLKASTTLLLVAFDAAFLALCTNTSNINIPHTRATFAAAILTLVASLGVCLLSWLEHERTFNPSFLLFNYLFLSVLLGLAHTRTLWMFSDYRVVPAIFTCGLVFRAVLLVLESLEKRNLLYPQYRDCSKEMTRSVVSNAVFWWLNPLFFKGYKKSLVLQDLYPLEETLQSKPLYEALANAWKNVANKDAPGALFNTWLSVAARPLLACIIPRLLQIGFTYAQPFLITSAIEFAVTPRGKPYDNRGYGLIGAFAIVYTGLAISLSQYTWRVRRLASMLKGSVVGLIYQESLRLDLTSPGVSPTAALTLISADTDTVVQCVYQLNEVWASVVEIAVADYLIYRQMGAACAMPFAVAFVAVIATVLIAASIGKAQVSWLLASQERVTVTSKALGSIKWLKISGLTNVAFSMIRTLRIGELKVSLKYRRLLALSMIILIFVPVWSPILTFCVYAGLAQRSNSSLSLSSVFTSYSVLVLLSGPLITLIMALPYIAGGLASFQRIQNHLNGKKRHDNRENVWSENSSHMQPPRSDKPLVRLVTTTIAGPNQNHETSGNGHELAEIAEISTSLADLERNIIASVQGKFSWPENSEPVINISEWKIRRRMVTLVLGPVGCGKSTLLKSLLGELSTFEGTIRTNYSGVAYCSQNPWIPNETVRYIITGGANFDNSWYRAVIKACALEKDIRDWPNGDDTEAGSTGISMSGGQKQRLSIARALYSRKEFLILDNVFSGLDPSTESLVFDNLWGKEGLLRTAEITVVLASSDDSAMPYTDQVLLLNEQGEIQVLGTPDQVENLQGLEAAIDSRKKQQDTNSVPTSESSNELIGNASKVMETEMDSTRRLGDWKVYGFYAKAAGRITLAIFFIAIAFYAFCTSFPIIWLGWWATASAKRPNEDLGKWLGVYVALGVGAILGALLGIRQFMEVIINKCGVYFHNALLDTVSRAPMSFHATVDSGITLNRFSEDIRLIDVELPTAAFGVAITVFFLSAQLIVACVSSRYLVATLPFFILTFYALQHFYLRTSRQLRLLDIECRAPLYTQLIETMNGLVTIRAFQWEDRFTQKNLSLLDDSRRPGYLLTCIQCWLTYAIDMVIMLVAVTFIIVTTTLREQIGPSYMGIGLSSVLGLSGSAKTFITFWVLLEVALGAVVRIRSFTLDTESEEDPKSSFSDSESNDWPSRGAIELHNVVASYTPSKTCLDNVTLSIQPGQKVAICGRTGSGKSSLTLCLLRMLNLDSGSITIDNINLTQLSHDFVSSKLIALPQEVYILEGSVRLNIDPTKEIPDANIVLVLEKVQLWEKINARGGLDAIVDDKFFSTGEAQLLVFARAMLRKSKVLILDEFTSSLDDNTSQIVNSLLRSWFEGWTIIAVAHKLGTILDFDKVAVLDDGKLLEYDEPRRLLERDSVFRELYELSSR